MLTRVSLTPLINSAALLRFFSIKMQLFIHCSGYVCEGDGHEGLIVGYLLEHAFPLSCLLITA